MKKSILFFVASIMMVSVGHAQIAIMWDSTGFISEAGIENPAWPDDYLPAGTAHLLIWSSTAAPVALPGSQGYAQPGTGLGVGEFILYSHLDGDPDNQMDGGRFNYAANPLEFDDDDVGGADINAGYVYSRIFEKTSINAGDNYFQSLVSLEPTIPAYDPTAPLTIQEHRTNPYSFEMGDITHSDAGDGMYTVIPEPSVFALLGLGGLFLAIRRRFVNKK